VQIVKQGAEGLIGRRQQIADTVVVVLMRVPAAAIDVDMGKARHERDACLDEPPREQSALPLRMPAVTIAHALRVAR
jgi:hypothetical protein